MSIFTRRQDDITYSEYGFEIKKNVRGTDWASLFILLLIYILVIGICVFLAIFGSLGHVILAWVLGILIIIATVAEIVKSKKKRKSKYYGCKEYITLNEAGISLLSNYSESFVPWSEVASFGFLSFVYPRSIYKNFIYVSSAEVCVDDLKKAVRKYRLTDNFKIGLVTYEFESEGIPYEFADEKIIKKCVKIDEAFRERILEHFRAYAVNGKEVNYIGAKYL